MEGEIMWKSIRFATILFISAILSTQIGCAQTSRASLPPTPVDSVVDTLFGVPVADPYRWLEDGKSEKVREWTEAENAYYRQYVEDYSGYQKVLERLGQLWSIGSIGAPAKHGDFYFYFRREVGQNHSVLYMKKGLTGPEQVAIDPNGFSEDGTVAMDWTAVSDSGKLVAYGKSASGSERTTLYIMETESRKILPDTIPYTRACGLAWMPDAKGFYYTRFPAPGSVPAGDENYYRSVYFHHLGDDWHNDSLIFSTPSDKTSWSNPFLSPDGRYLFISIWYSGSIKYVYLKDLHDLSSQLQPIVDNVDARFSISSMNDRFYILTDYGAPRYRVLEATYDKPSLADWKEVIPEGTDILQDVSLIDSSLVVRAMRNASSSIDIYGLSGRHLRSISLPTLGSAGSLSGEIGGKEMYFGFDSFTMPSTIFRYDFDSDSLAVVGSLKAPVDLSNIEVKQVWYPSKDGTPVSMFIVARKGLKRDGTNPAYLYGYGGFNISMMPYYSSNVALWLDAGGVYALPNIRGGGEYGKEWHDNGKLEKKQNSFDDFIAAAQYLIDSGYTNANKLAISGGSNGGLLVGAVLTQRPDLFKAAVCAVPLLDMLRYQNFQVARLWIPEYGSSEDSAQFQYLFKYSPYQHVRKGVAYPAVLLTAGESDSRVDPLHARKMAAELQAATSSDNPILLYVEMKAGHGQGKPVSKRIEDAAGTWSFVFRALGIKYGE